MQDAINALPEAERPEVICSASAVGEPSAFHLYCLYLNVKFDVRRDLTHLSSSHSQCALSLHTFWCIHAMQLH